MTDGPISGENIQGTGIVFGHGSSANVTIIGQTEADKLTKLLSGLEADLASTRLADGLKESIRDSAIDPMQNAAVSGGDPNAIVHGLQRLNDKLEGAGEAADGVRELALTAKKVASAIGVTLSTIAPFLARLVA
jgi:hypothetical protein